MKKFISVSLTALSLVSLSSSAHASWLSEAAKSVGLPLPSLPPVMDFGTPIEPSTSCLAVVSLQQTATIINRTGGPLNYAWRQGGKAWANLILEDGMQQYLEGGYAGQCNIPQAIYIRFENGNGIYHEYTIGGGRTYDFSWHNGKLDVYEN